MLLMSGNARACLASAFGKQAVADGHATRKEMQVSVHVWGLRYGLCIDILCANFGAVLEL